MEAERPIIRALLCVECGFEAQPEARGWRGYLVDGDEDGADELALFCPRCAEHEFGDRR